MTSADAVAGARAVPGELAVSGELVVPADRAILDAGGIVPVAAAEGAGAGGSGGGRSTVDTVTARAYTNPALDDGHVVVRLLPANLGAAEDLAMESLGFTPAAEPVPVGAGLRRALGFPGWAIVNDPANAGHALALVKDMERLARLARSKPGHALTGYAEHAEHLGRTVPHFLPTFWEQAGRAFVDGGAPKVASACFGRAREAERVHALAVDEQRLADAYVEFALAGALPVKALQAYARDLAGRLPAEQAFPELRAVALQRVAGGLPPYARILDDISRLARAAGHRQFIDVVEELIALPATAGAPAGFWKSCRKDLTSLAAKSPQVCGRLLAMMPDPPGREADPTDEWVSLLDATGATACLTGDGPPEAAPPGGAAVWLERFLAHRRRRWRARTRSAPLIDLVERMGPKLRADTRPVDISDRSWDQIDLDVLDALLAAGAPVTLPIDRGHGRAGRGRLDVHGWLADPTPGRRALEAIATDPRFAEAFVDGTRVSLIVDAQSRSDGRLDSGSMRALTHPVLRGALVDRAADVAERVAAAPTDATLHYLRAEFDQLALPEVVATARVTAALRRVDIAAALARTLRAGVIEELCWPALDEAIAQFPGITPNVDTSWPHAVVHNGVRAIVVGPRGPLREISLPAVGGGRSRPTCLVVDGAILVIDDQWRQTGQWVGDDRGPFDLGSYHINLMWKWSTPTAAPRQLALPGGGCTLGVGEWQPHTRRTLHAARPLASDGTSFWHTERLGADPSGWREYDPVTDRTGPPGAPAFFAEAGYALEAQACALHRLPPDVTGRSLLGAVDGLAGWRTGTVDGVTHGEGIDGRRRSMVLPPGAWFLGLVDLPGSDVPRPVVAPRSGTLSDVVLCDPETGAYASLCDGGPAVPPQPFWHWMRPRDEASSRALRGLDEAAAARMLSGFREYAADGGTWARLSAVVGEAMPELRDETLVRAVVRRVQAIIEHERWLERFLAWIGAADAAAPAVPRTAAARPAIAPAEPPVTSADFAHVMLGMNSYERTHGLNSSDSAGNVPRKIAALGEVLSGRSDGRDGLWYGVNVHHALGTEPVLLMRAASPAFPAGRRRAACKVLAALVEADLVGNAGCVSYLHSDDPTNSPKVAQRDGAVVNVVYVFHSHSASMLQYDRARRFPDIPGFWRINISFDPNTSLTSAGVTAFLDAWAAHGAPAWRPEAVERLATATGMAAAEAAYILAGLPDIEVTGHLPVEMRTPIGVTAKAAKAARDRLATLSKTQQVELLDAVIPADPADLWRTGPDVDRVAAAWLRLFPARLGLSDELMSEAVRFIGPDAEPVVSGLTAAEPADWCAPDTIKERHVLAAGLALPWLAYRLPAGDPGRTRLPGSYQRLFSVLSRSPVSIHFGHGTEVPEYDSVRGDPVGAGDFYDLRLLPAKLRGRDDPGLAIASMSGKASQLRLLYSQPLADLCAAIAAEPATLAGHLQDPRLCVPDLVAEVASRHDLDPDAAAYYLQLLALPDPTDRNVAAWTGRPSAALAADRAMLAARGLAVVAKRERAGRSAFLPGGWIPLKAPRLPVERWKLPLYGWHEDDLPGERHFTVVAYVPELFRRAYTRIAEGDVPRLEPLTP